MDEKLLLVRFLASIKELNLRFPVAEICKKTGYKSGIVSEYMNGRKDLSESFLRKDCEVFELSYGATFLGNITKWEEMKILFRSVKGDRLAKLISNTGYESEEDFANDTEVNVDDVRLYIQGTKPIPSKFYDVLESKFEINKQYLSSGMGEMFIKKQSEIIAYPRPDEAKQVPHDDFMEVPYIPAQAQAGYASGFADAQYYDVKQLPTMLVSKEYEKGNYLVVEAIGDSMDDGTSRTISNGDKILVKELDRGAWVFKLNFKKYLFVIVTKDGVVFKQITNHNLESKTITCHSFNPIIPDFELSLDQDVLQLFYVKKVVDKSIVF